MPYPTPGFVVYQTFLELEEQGAPVAAGGNLVRSKSDTNLLAAKGASKFGSEALRLFYEGGREDEEAVGEGEARPTEASSPPPGANRAAPPPSSASDAESEDSWTTVHLQQLPPEYSREELAETLVREGFGSFNFVFLPMDFRTRMGFCYAFVNFGSHEVAQAALQHFDGFSAWKVESPQACVAIWSQYCQGLHALIERYRSSPIMHEAVPDIYKPRLYEAGQPVAFPAPRQRLRMPRLRKLKKQTVLRSDAAGSASTMSPSARGNHSDNGDVWFVDLVASRGLVVGFGRKHNATAGV